MPAFDYTLATYSQTIRNLEDKLSGRQANQQDANDTQIAWSLTSTLRRYNGSKAGKLGVREGTKLDNLPNTDTAAPVVPGFPAVSNLWRDIIFPVNPHTIRFKQDKRYSKQDTLGGSTYHHFTDQDGYSRDVLNLTLEGSTGNINQASVPLALAEDRAVIDLALEAWRQVYLLTLEPAVLPNGVENRTVLTVVSKFFTTPVHFYGFFPEVFPLTETAAKRNTIDYSTSFIVTDMKPNLAVLWQAQSAAQPSK